MQDRHRDVALFRYSVIREAADASLTKAERGEMVRALARRDHLRADGKRVTLSRNTLDRWIRACAPVDLRHWLPRLGRLSPRPRQGCWSWR